MRDGPAALQEPFSRSRWIARLMDRVPFSGGVLPATEPRPPMPVPAAAPAVLGPGSDGVTAPVRVNGDLLPPAHEGQPETQTEPYLAIDPLDPDHLLAVYQENRFATGGARALNFAVSTDGGASWEEGILPGLTPAAGGPWERASDPWVAFGPGGRAYYASLLFNETTPDSAIGVSVSVDGGHTWSPPVEVFRSRPDFNDKEAVAVDASPGSPFYGHVYVGWDINIVEGDRFVAQELLVARSADGGISYEPPVRVRTAGHNIGAIPQVGPDGTVYLVWAGTLPGGRDLFVFFSRSRDGGRRWSEPRIVAELGRRGVPGMRVGSILPSFAVDRESGHLYVAWQDARWTGVDHATLIVSRDGGSTWSAPQRVSDGPDGTPSFTVAVAADGGQVAVGYLSLQNAPRGRFLVDAYLRVSRDGGRSFEPSRRVTPGSFDVRFAAWSRGFFLGDYHGLAAGGGRFHLLWVATYFPSLLSPPLEPLPRRLQPDVFTARTR